MTLVFRNHAITTRKSLARHAKLSEAQTMELAKRRDRFSLFEAMFKNRCKRYDFMCVAVAFLVVFWAFQTIGVLTIKAVVGSTILGTAKTSIFKFSLRPNDITKCLSEIVRIDPATILLKVTNRTDIFFVWFRHTLKTVRMKAVERYWLLKHFATRWTKSEFAWHPFNSLFRYYTG